MLTLEETRNLLADLDSGKIEALSLPDLPIEFYHHRDCIGISNSRLSLVRQSPAHFKAWKDGLMPEKESDSLTFGNALHTLLLEPSHFEKRYCQLPEKMRNDPRTKAYQEWYSEHQGKTVLSGDEWESCHRIVASIFQDAEISQYLDPGLPKQIEKSFFWRDKSSGIVCKSRTDIWVADQIVIDLKTTRSAKPRDFGKSVHDYRYLTQAAMQIDGIQACEGKPTHHYLWIAVEKEPPYIAQAYRLKRDDLQMGRLLYQADLALIRACEEAGAWQGYFTGIQDLELPDWAYTTSF